MCPNLNAAVAKLLIIEGFTDSSYLETVARTVTIKQTIILCPFSVCGPRVRVTPEPPLPVAVSYRDGEEVVAGEGGPAQHHRQPLRARYVLHTGAQLCQFSKLLHMQAMFDSAVYYSEEAPTQNITMHLLRVLFYNKVQ